MHELNIVHRDLKCDNVLFDSATGLVKIADFGTARVLETSLSSSGAATMIGTPLFMAPEVLGCAEDGGDDSDINASGRSGYGTKADIWSFGIMMLVGGEGRTCVRGLFESSGACVETV